MYNEKIPLWNEKLPIVHPEDVNEAVPPTEPQGPQMPQMLLIPQIPQAPYVEGDITNVEIRDALRVLTQLMTTQAQVVTSHVVAQAKLGVGHIPQPNTSTLAFRIQDFMRMSCSTFHET